VADVTRDWLRDNDIRALGGHLKNFSAIGVVMFPTLVMTDRGLTVTDIVEGPVSEVVQAQLLDRIAMTGAPVSLAQTAKEITRLAFDGLCHPEGCQFVDARDRKRFDAAHSPRAVNMPLDEVAVRAPAEFDEGVPTVVDCSYSPIGECREAGSAFVILGFKSVSLLLPH